MDLQQAIGPEYGWCLPLGERHVPRRLRMGPGGGGQQHGRQALLRGRDLWSALPILRPFVA